MHPHIDFFLGILQKGWLWNFPKDLINEQNSKNKKIKPKELNSQQKSVKYIILR